MENQVNKFRDSFPQSIAKDTFMTTLAADVSDLIGEMQTNSDFFFNFILCLALVILVSIFNYVVSINALFCVGLCRIASIVAFFLIKQEISLPFQPDSLMKQYRGKIIPFLLNGIARIITQSCTAHIAGLDSLISMHIITMWSIITVFEIFTSLDLRVYDKLLCHAPRHLSLDVKDQLESDKETVEIAVKAHHILFRAYVFLQYVLYTVHTLNLVSLNRLTAQWVSTIITLFTVLYLEFLYQPLLANQSYFVLPTRFYMHLLYLHFTIFSGLYFFYPAVLHQYGFHASVLFIAFCGCIAILNLVVSELKSSKAYSSSSSDEQEGDIVVQQPEETKNESKGEATPANRRAPLPRQSLFRVPLFASDDFTLHRVDIPPGLYLTSISISANSVYILKRFQDFVVTDLLGWLPAPWNYLWKLGVLLPLLTATFLWCESAWFYLLTVAFSHYI